MEIYICGIDELPKFIEQYKPTHVLSLQREGEPTKIATEIVNSFGGIKHHVENFDDLDSLDKEWYDSKSEKDRYVELTFPTKEHILNITSWLNSSLDLDSHGNLKDDNTLIVHCSAGVSRSTAMAFGITVYLTSKKKGKILEIFESLTIHRPNHYMNTLILKLWDDVLGTDLQALYKNWDEFIEVQIFTREKSIELVREFIKKYKNGWDADGEA